ncbi:MAG TPA: MBL fold metallo-hydrolase [Candidatus Baltobacteraceae bacterium]|jgi:phosphoribosyl 1,2-cyclic phosphodiesterase|nr:MBL fold metallo-hydrolase [Candidatus Baltobacteraceae bacterium]
MVSIRFLGTGGARFVVARQIRASGGIWLRFENGENNSATQIHLDPGPGALVRALSCVPPCAPEELTGIVLSHKHLDHAGDVNAMIEAMTIGGYRRHGTLLAPADAYAGEAVIFPYAARFVQTQHVTQAHGGPYQIGTVEIRSSLRHQHGVETYGLHFRHENTCISYLPCTRYFDALIDDYRSHEPDVLIINVLRFRDALEVDHLTFFEARDLIAGIRPRVAVMTHFGTKMLEQDPDRLARELEDELGLRVLAARDGWTLDVTSEIAAAHERESFA